MGKLLESGQSVEDNEESDEFLCAVAADSVNDAILLLRELRSGPSSAMCHLEQALALLADEGHPILDGEEAQAMAEDGRTAPGSGLSPMAIDLIVERRLRELDANMHTLNQKERRFRPNLESEASGRIRQQAIMLMVEALGLLDSIHDDDATAHLQLAIDRTLNQQPGLALTGRPGEQKPH